MLNGRSRGQRRTQPAMRAAIGLRAEQRGQSLIDAADAEPEPGQRAAAPPRRRAASADGRSYRACKRPLISQTIRVASRIAAGSRRAVSAPRRREWRPAPCRRQLPGPAQPLAHVAAAIQRLAAQAAVVQRHLRKVQVFVLGRHAMGRAGPGRADLQYARLHLHIKSQDMAAEVGEHAVAPQRIPEAPAVFPLDHALVVARVAVDGPDRMMAEDQLVPGVALLLQDTQSSHSVSTVPSPPLLDTQRVDEYQQQDRRAGRSMTGRQAALSGRWRHDFAKDGDAGRVVCAVWLPLV